MSIPAGSTFQVTVTGQYGPFEGVGAQDAITSTLNGNNIIVSNFIDNQPSLVSQVLSLDVFGTPYQFTIQGTIETDFTDTTQIGNVVAAAVAAALGSNPISWSVDSVNGASTGALTQSTPVWAATQLGAAATNAVGGALSSVTQPLTSSVVLILGIIVVGLVLVAKSGAVKVNALV